MRLGFAWPYANLFVIVERNYYIIMIELKRGSLNWELRAKLLRIAAVGCCYRIMKKGQ